MARMYSRKRGRSGSKKPLIKKAPWVKYSPREIEDIILKLSKKGYQSSRIGLILRDQYGIPNARIKEGGINQKITALMKKHGLYPKFPEDMFNLIKKAVNLRAHLAKNRRDYTSQRGLELTESKIRRLAKYYKKRDMIPADWKYDPEKAKLLVK